jgi:hypothetical protein
MSKQLGLRLMSLVMLAAMALHSIPTAGVASAPQAGQHKIYMPVVTNGEIRLERTFPKAGASVTALQDGDWVAQTWTAVDWSKDRFIVVPVQNGATIPLAISTAVITKPLPLLPGTILGSTVTLSGQAGPDGVVITIGAIGATILYALYKSVEGQLLKPREIPSPSTVIHQQWVDERNAMLADQTSPEVRPNVMVAMTSDPPNPPIGPPCQAFLKNGNGKWPHGWKLASTIRGKNYVRVIITTEQDVLVGYAEVYKVGPVAHAYANISAPFRRDYIATTAIEIAGDIYAFLNNRSGSQRIILDDLMGQMPWFCLKQQWPLLQQFDQWMSMHTHSSFAAEAARLGIPPYLPLLP